MGDILTPIPGFHFAVVFELPFLLPSDFRFQKVSGLQMSMDVAPYKQGGDEGTQQRLYVSTSYSDLTLTRGLFVGSGIYQWCNEAIQEKNIKPVNVTISLLDDNHFPVMGWYVINAYPTQLVIGEFNAEESKLAVETLTLHYERFENIRI